MYILGGGKREFSVPTRLLKWLMNIILGVTFDLISETSLWVGTAYERNSVKVQTQTQTQASDCVATGISSNMPEPAADDNLAFKAEDNLAFEGICTTPAPLGTQSMLAKKGFGERRASELTESMLRYNRRDQHLAHVSCPLLLASQDALEVMGVSHSLSHSLSH